MKTNNKEEFEEFMDFLKDTRRGFPRWEYLDVDKKFIESQFKILLDKEFFIELTPIVDDKGETHRAFMLGAPMLSLISSWESEKLNKNVHKLTKYLLILASIALAVAINQLYVMILQLIKMS